MAKTQHQIVEEVQFKSDSAFLCAIVNRRIGLIRVIDFRAGTLPAKRLFIQNVAKRENIEKVILLVEKDEVSSWTRLGFTREGQIPGFYKRSDGHLVGWVVDKSDGATQTMTKSQHDDAQKLAERTTHAGKRNAREIPAHLPQVQVEMLDAEDAFQMRDEAWKKQSSTLLSGFDSFGRDAERFFVKAMTKKGNPNYLSAEFQDCFGHSLLEVMRSPSSDADVIAITAALRAMSDDLKERGIVSAFAFAPYDDVGLATAYVAAGFRKTGFLASGTQVGPKRKDAILWTRKLASPDEEEEN